MTDGSLYRSKDTRLGAFFTLLVIGVAAGAWFVSRPVATGPVLFAEYDEVFGLSQGDPVTLNGLQIGNVEAIATEFLDMGGVRFLVTLRLDDALRAPDDSLRLNAGTQALIVPAALPFLGRAQVRLVPDFESAARLADEAIVFGAADTSLLDALGAQAGQLVFSVTQVTGQLSELMDSIQTTRAEADATLRMVRSEVPQMTALIETRLDRVDAFLVSADDEIRRTTPEIRELLDSLTVLSGEARELMASVDETVQARVPDVDVILARMDTASFVVNHLAEKLAENPLRIFWGVDVPDSIPPRGGG